MAGDKASCRQPEHERAFLELITRVEGELRGVVRRHVGSVQVTQDIVQRTFLLAWRHATFDPTHAFAHSWLFKTARRLVSDWLASGESNSISLEDLSERARRDGSRGSRSAVPVDGRAGDPLTILIDEERSRGLGLALGRLEDDQREVIERYYLRQEGTQVQIAAAMGLSLAAFNSRLNRARKELKRQILKLRGPDGWMGLGHGVD
jgi:RNA polymerase sigma factor (sigma-70 family)